MRISDDRYEKDLRRYQLAWRMLQLEARRSTVAAWTGLSRYRVQSLARGYNTGGRYARLRGPAPYKAKFFSRSLAHECESAALAYIGLQMQVIPADDASPVQGFVGLARGEQLVNAFELYRALVPQSRFTLEFVVLLMTELAQRKSLAMTHCDRCGGVMVVERAGTQHRHCAFCRIRRLRVPKQRKSDAETVSRNASAVSGAGVFENQRENVEDVMKVDAL